MDSPPQDQRTGSPNMLDLDQLVQKVQDVQDIRGKMHRLRKKKRKKIKALQESSQQSELDPTKSEVQKLQTHIQQLEDNMKEMAEKRIQLLNECTDCLDQCQSRWISRLKEWKWEQQKAVIGHPFDKNLNPLQSWCEQLFEVNKNLREELKLTGESMSELQDRLEKLLKVLVQSSLVVDKQPPQVIKICSTFSTTVRCLLGEKVKPVVLKAKIINEVQARDLDSGPSDDAGELLQHIALLKPDTTNKGTCAIFLIMRIKNIKRPDIQGSKPETEQKFALLFSIEIFIPGCDAPYRIQIMSLPVVVIRSPDQHSSARATIIWDCAFSEADRVPFMVPEQVPWSTMFKTLNRKFTAEVQTQHNLDQHNQHCLAEKIFNKPDCADDFSNTMVSWAQFNEEVLPGQQFTFWEWFEGVMELTEAHLKTYWSEGLIFGVVGKQKLHQILRDSPTGTFLLHFSHSKIGGIIITFVSATEKGEPQIQSTPPFNTMKLYIRNLGNRILDNDLITHLYPDIPKDKVFKRFYSEPRRLPYYIPQALHIGFSRKSYLPRPSGPVMDSDDDISDTEDKRPVGSHSTETPIPLKKYSAAAISVDLRRSMDPSSQSSSSSKRWKGKSRGCRSRRKKKYEPSHSVASPFDLNGDMLVQPPSVRLTETGMVKNQSPAADATAGFSRDNIMEMDLHETAGPSTLQLSTSDDDDSDSADFCDRKMEWDELSISASSTDSESFPFCGFLPNTKYKDDFRPVFKPEYTDAYEWSSAASESASGAESDAMMEMETTLTGLKYLMTNTQPTHCGLQILSSDPGWSERDSSCLSRSHSVPSLSQTTSAENKTFPRSQSLPDMLKSSCEEFTPDISVDEDDETYRFQCSCPGLYQCSVTGLLFHMEGEGDVLYRTVPWDRRLLAQHHKRPAGPLFDIKCVQQSVCQLHLPHCEIRSTGGGGFLSVAHVTDEGIQFIVPHKITETHVVINITGFSGFGNVKDEDSPPDPVRALVLLFYRPPADPDPDLPSFLKVLMLPRNVVIEDVVRKRRKLDRNEIYIDTVSKCDLRPNQEYTLSICPEDDSVRVQPKKAEFDCDNYDNYITSFQVRLNTILKIIDLVLRDTDTSNTVWEGEVCLLTTAVRRSCRQGSSSETLFKIRSDFIDGISGPVLNSLLDELLKRKVITGPEMESANAIQVKRDKARFVIDTVRAKGEAASSEMIEFLCEVDPFLCEHLGLI